MTAALIPLAATAGCATFKNTPQQEYIYDMSGHCDTHGVQINWVSADGTQWRGFWHGGAATWPEFQQCMREHIKDHPYAEWLQQNRKPAHVAAPAGVAPGGGVNVATSMVTASRPEHAVTWARGDQWSYRWTSPSGSGTFVWVVDREEAVDDGAYYVLRAGTRELFIRKSDFATYMERVSGRVEARNTPPAILFPSPVAAGAQWGFSYTREPPLDRETDDISLICASTAETITVPAGSFETVKVACRNARTNAPFYEAWLSTAVKQLVRDRSYLPTGGVRERELTSFRVR